MVSKLPRLLYIGDVPVESSYHGSALLYRLLQAYQSEKLRIIEAGLESSRLERRLAGVRYDVALQPGRRWLHTRFHAWVAAILSLLAPQRWKAINARLAGFQPEAVLTVAHGFSWLTAAAYAQRLELPLHLIVHDDLPTVVKLPRPVKSWFIRQFTEVYLQATSRLCVSPYMVEEYERRYGVRGDLLYPSRAADVAQYSRPPERLTERGRPLVFGFGGTINTGGHVLALNQLSSSLQKIGAQLHMYGPIDVKVARRVGLERANVKICDLVPAKEFVDRMRSEVDILFLPMSFASQDRSNMTLLFPSKLTDYTAAGLPILIYGPAYSSAVRWARENPGVAEVLTDEDATALGKIVDELAHSPARRHELGLTAMEVGERYFTCTSAQRTLENALQMGSSAVATREAC